MRCIRVAIPFLLVSAAMPVLLVGCSMSYTFIVTVIVKDAQTGKPLGNVNVGLTSNKFGSRDVDFPNATNDQGQLEFDWNVSDRAFSSTSETSLIVDLTKAGYIDESVNIGPLHKPASGESPLRIMAFVYMRLTE